MSSMVASEAAGARVRRKEDPRLITGSATYVDDLRLAGTVHLALVRSPYPHAKIKGIDASAALDVPGVLRVITAKEFNELAKPLVGGEGGEGEAPEVEGEIPNVEPLATSKVRYVGEAVAAVIAETAYAARDGADAVMVDYEPLPVVMDPEKAMGDDSPLLYDTVKNNIGVQHDKVEGDVDVAFQNAKIVVKQRIRSQRLSGVPLEGRATAATPDPTTGGITVWTSTQAAHAVRNSIAAALGLSQSQVRAIAPEVGGGFGVKIGAYQEDLIVSTLAYTLKLPVKWIETRSENFLVTNHGRDQIAYMEAAADENGKVLGLRMRVIADLGAWPKGLFLPATTSNMAVGCYDIPAVDIHNVGVYTNKMALGAYRGAGRPESAYYIERIMDLIAAEGNLDPVEVRRVNFIKPEQFPYTTATGERYDTGEYEKPLNRALEISGYAELRKEQEEARKQGRYLGIGLATYVEICGFGPWESSTVRVEPGGDVSIFTGISPHGQGQETTFSQLAAEYLGADFDKVIVHHGDTSNTPHGKGTMGSRGLSVGGSALMMSIDKIQEKAHKIAAHLLEASLDDIEFENGRWQVKGTPDQGVTLVEIADAAYGGNVPDGVDAGLQTTDFFSPEDETFPFGTHIAVVEVFPDTGQVKLLNYYSVDDCGPRISPTLVEGQIHGGLVQGIAQALFEEIVYDDNGQLLTGTLMDYAMPKAEEFPMFTLDSTVTKTPLNPLGVKGIGEAATIGATPSVANAVIDALKPFGITHMDVPFRSERVWAAINGSQNGSGS